MPCGCKKGRWAPSTAVTAAAGDPKGPKAPGYEAAPTKTPSKSTSGAKKTSPKK